jgi:hypothetical protein
VTILSDPPAAHPTRRRGPRRRWLWVLCTIALGALLGAGLGFVVDPAPDRVFAVNPAAPERSPSVSVPAGLIAGITASSVPALVTPIDNRVFVVGDSVMQGASPYLPDLMPDWSLIIDTKVGRFLDEAIRVLDRRREEIADIAVLNLGNNYGGDEITFAAEVEKALDTLAGVRHVIWVNAAEFTADRAEVNQVLRDAATRHPNLVIVDWNSWWAQRRSFTTGDRLHLTEEGARAYATLVALAVRQVTEAAGEYPKPGVSKPVVQTRGTIPDAPARRTSPTRSRAGTRPSSAPGTPSTVVSPTTGPARSPSTSAGAVSPTTAQPPTPTSAPGPPSPPPTADPPAP